MQQKFISYTTSKTLSKKQLIQDYWYIQMRCISFTFIYDFIHFSIIFCISIIIFFLNHILRNYTFSILKILVLKSYILFRS